ncbi:hypothetical protein GQ457_12G015340 [Hibiscus cannabinus]
MKEPGFLDDSSIEEDKGEKLDNENSEEKHANVVALAASQPASDEVRPPPPFPQRLKKHKEDLQFEMFVITKERKVESYEIVVVASEYCAGRIDLPMKKKDPGNFIIPCSIWINFKGNALCDFGSSFNLMPKAVFKKIGIGIERPNTVIL